MTNNKSTRIPSVQLCVGYHVKTGEPVSDPRPVHVHMDLLELDVKPVSWQCLHLFLMIMILSEFHDFPEACAVTIITILHWFNYDYVLCSGVQSTLSQRRTLCVSRWVQVSTRLEWIILWNWWAFMLGLYQYWFYFFVCFFVFLPVLKCLIFSIF